MAFAAKSPIPSPVGVRTLALAAFLVPGISFILTGLPTPAASQSPASVTFPSGTPRSWIDAAANNQLAIVNDTGNAPLRFREHKIDAKGDTLREVIETRQGNVARLIERNGKPLTAAEDAAERSRLNAILTSPDDFIKHHKHDRENRDNTLQLVRLLPTAMLYTYAPGQPQPPGATSPQVVLDFQPDPNFHPPMLSISGMLTGLAGRMWIDAKTRRLTRAEAHVLQPINFGWGIFARVAPGGTLEFEQTPAPNERWAYSHLDMSLSVRVAMVKTVPVVDRDSATDFRPLPAPVTFQEAVKLLLATPVTLR